MASTIRIRAAWDDEAGVWFVEESDIFGVNAEAATLEELRDKLPNVIADVLTENDPSRLRHDLTVEIIARSQTRIPATDAA
jgi:predicted RNase H-like HicB family nuclease